MPQKYTACALLALSLGAAPERINAAANEALAGGEGSVLARGADAFSHPARNATPLHRKEFVVGNSLFKENWVSAPASVRSRQGLGPQFNAQSCSSCHFRDGRGQPPTNTAEAFSSMLIRLSIPGQNEHGGPLPVPNYGDQLNHRGIVGVKSEGDVRVSYKTTSGLYPDGTPYELLVPSYEFKDLRFGALPPNLRTSARVAPSLIGLGLLEAVSEAAILARADPEDKDGNGIRGRANKVWDIKSSRLKLGRFGWKANQPSVHQQNAGAFAGDMGISSRMFPLPDCAPIAADCLANAALTKVPDIDDHSLSMVTSYTKILAVPMRRKGDDAAVKAGALAFGRAGCDSCHTPAMHTGVDPEFPENSNQQIFPYTDLLLHDMGEGLADGRDDFAADGRSWRTSPLWGIGLTAEVNGHTRFLHDGRARNLEEAVLWHGGEAEPAKAEFLKLPKTERSHLIQFLESL